MIALLIGYESVERLLHPVPIAFTEAIPIAALGLGVNLISAWLLHDDDRPHGAAHGERTHDTRIITTRSSPSRDLNLRAAYVHVMADAAVSVLAIVGLTAGRVLGWVWMDPVMGIVGTLVIANWSCGLVRIAGAVLLDMRPDGLAARDRGPARTGGGDRITDLHLWRVGPGHQRRGGLDRLRPPRAARCLQGPARRHHRAEPCHDRGPALPRRTLTQAASRKETP